MKIDILVKSKNDKTNFLVTSGKYKYRNKLKMILKQMNSYYCFNFKIKLKKNTYNKQ